MNIVMVSPHFGPVPGGIQKDMLCLAREMLAMGDRVTVVTTCDEFPEGRVDLSQPLTYDLPAGLELIRLEGKRRTRLRNFHPANPPLWIPELAETILRRESDGVIFFNIGWPLTVLPALLKLRRSTTILYRTAYHSQSSRQRLDPQRSRLQLRTAGLSHKLVAYSEHEKAQIIRDGGLHPEQIAVVYPGVDKRSISDAALKGFRDRYALHGKIVISHVARLSAFKGTDRLIRVLPEIRRRTGRDVVLLLVGRNLEEDRLAAAASAAGVAAHIRTTGPVSEEELHMVYAASDVFALPSRYESFGFVFLEAMAHGVPVIGVRTGGVPEVIRDGETGIILDSAEDEAALADALTNLIADDATRARYALTASQWANGHFRWSIAADEMRGLLGAGSQALPTRLEFSA